MLSTSDITVRLGDVRVLGLDVDGPVYPLGDPWRSWLTSRGYARSRALHDPTGLQELVQPRRLTDEQFLFELEEASKAEAIYVHGEPYEDAAHWVPRIHASGIGIHLVTARSQTLARQQTTTWMTQVGLPFDRLTLSSAKHQVEGYDLLVDDSANNVRRVLEAGRMAVLLDRSWNRDVTDLPRVTWDDLGTALTRSAAG